MESLERSLCDFVTLYGKEQQALKAKVEVLESLLCICMPNTPTTVQSVRNEVSASPKRLFSPKIAHKRIDRKSTRLNSQSHSDLVCRLLLEKQNLQRLDAEPTDRTCESIPGA